jgi:hypothetical protein
MALPPNLLPWSEVRVWIEDSLVRSTHFLSHRRAIVALAHWKAGEPSAYHRYVDVAGARALSDPAEVDWSGFPPSTEPHG